MPAMPQQTLFETHLMVSDLKRSFAFYRDVVGLEPAHLDLERHVAFFWIGERGRGMLGLWAVSDSARPVWQHIAFGTALDKVLSVPRQLAAMGVTPLNFFRQTTTEPSVIGWMPAASVYFKDPDGHLLEYISMLSEAPRPDLGVLSFGEWVAKAANEAARA